MNTKELILEQTVYAQGLGNEDKMYYVYPISPSRDKLATLSEINDNMEEIGDRFKVPISDLFEFYVLLDVDAEMLWNPEEHEEYNEE